MSSTPYPGIQATKVPLLGRATVVRKLEGHITKASADHVSVIGAPYIGKTTLLRHLAGIFKGGRDRYLTSCYLDLRHHTPESDDGFRTRFATELRSALIPVDKDVAQSIDASVPPEDLAAQLPLIFDYYEDTKKRLLIVLDGLDHFLAKSDISRNLWDYLRDIAQKPTCTVVTGSRAPLRELCKNPESQTSDFWNIFYDPPLFLGPFEEAERDELVAPMAEVVEEVEQPARKELLNWSGGHPALYAFLAAQVCEQAGSGRVGKDLVDRIAEEIVTSRSQLLQALWDECPVEVQGDLFSLATSASGAPNIPPERTRFARLRGFIDDSGSAPRPRGRLIERYAKQEGSDSQDLKRLFGAEPSYMASIRALPELRLAQLTAVPTRLRRNVEACIRDIESDPQRCLMGFRLITREALDLVFDKEAPGGQVPQPWRTEWQHGGGRSQRYLDWTRGGLPGDDAKRCGLLEEITTTSGRGDKLAQHVTRSTYVLVDYAKRVGDLGNHPDGDINPAYASACCLAAVELCERLAGEL